MRTAGLASILLLASGSVLGLPQYNQDSTDDAGGAVSGNFWWQQGNAGTSGSDIQDTLGNIFSQVVSAFNSSVAQVTTQGDSINSITPQQSKFCALGQGCVPWQLCQNDIISQSSSVVPGLVPYPDGAGYTGCGDVIGNVCCGIPKDVLDQQQQQSNAPIPNVYDTCSAGLQCVDIVNCNLYNGFIEPQVATYDNQPFVEYNKCTGVGATESVCCQAKPTVVDTSYQSTLASVPLNKQCASNQECVPYFQCQGGFLNTDGAGLLDVRTKPKSTCSHPEYPDVPAICCTDPSAPEPIVSITYAPTTSTISSSTTTDDTCDGYKVCVTQGLCDATGNIITDGGGLLDLRIIHKKCYVDGTTEVGVCCTPPGAPTQNPIPQIDICPKNSPCLAPGLCSGEALDSLGSWISYAPTGKIFSECTVGGGYDSGPGVCCINPIPQIDICPNDSPCLAPSACLGEALDSLGSWTSYAPTGKIYSECIVGGGYDSGPGVCCINPIPQIDICPKDSPCLAPSACLGEALDSLGSWTSYVPTGKIYSECIVGGGYESGSGVCCINPIPKIEICPRNSPCIEPSLCLGEVLDNTGSWTSYAPSGKIYSECTVGGGYTSGPGVCCINPLAPIKAIDCPDYNECVPNNQCDANGNIVTDGSGFIDIRNKIIACIVDKETYETGVCCKPPQPIIPVVDSCPWQSVCSPELLCTGQALDNVGSMISYASGLLYTSCPLSGDYATPGICCENPPPPTPAPLKTCTGNQVCVDQNTCDVNGNVVTDGAGIFDLRLKGVACYTDEAAYTVGVCCNRPIPVIDICPGESSCVPDFLCKGQVLDSNNAMTAYSSGGTWSQCLIGNVAGLMGVCCINPPPAYSTVAPIPAANQCGVRNQEEVLNTRIQSVIAKNEAQFGEFPWQAIIFLSNYTFKCGASLIGDKWLLTGAHCVSGFQPSDIQIRLGEWQVNSFDEPEPYKDVQIKGITVHPDFNLKNVQNNIAVLELSESVGIQYHINSICLPAPGQTFWNQKCIVSGWGKDSFEGNYQHILKKVEVPTVDKNTCQALLRKTRLGKWFSLHDSFICAGGEENKDACKGDGGGPLACEDPVSGRYVLAGMTSWGIGCGNKDVPGVYADVQGFSTWIQGVIGGNLDQQQQLDDPEVDIGSNPYGK